MPPPRSGSFPIGEAQIVGLFMESITYGVFLVTFGLCMRALLFESNRCFVSKRSRHMKWSMLIIAVLMFVFATLDVAFGLRHNLDAFIFYSGPGGPDAEFNNMRKLPNVMKAVDFVFQTAIGDAILIYRCLVIYNSLWYMIILPILLWGASLASGLMLIWVECTTHQQTTLDDPRIKPWLDTLTACTLTVNVLVTSLIIWKIRRVRSRTAPFVPDTHRLSRVIRIVLDSGLIYTVCVITFFGTTLAGSNAQYGVSDVVVQVIGITFNLIIIRVNNGTASDGADSASSPGRVSHTVRFLHSPGSGALSTVRTEIGVEVAIDVEQLTQRESITHKAQDS